MTRRGTARQSSDARAALVLATALACAGGCASSRWVDERVPGDLWGTSGAELGAVDLLGGAPSGRSRGDGADAAGADAADVALDTLIEVLLHGLAVR